MVREAMKIEVDALMYEFARLHGIGVIPIPMDINKIVVREEKKRYTVNVTLLQADPYGGFKTMVSKNVLNYYFTDGGIFYAEMDNGEWFMCPKENIHYIKVQQTYKKE